MKKISQNVTLSEKHQKKPADPIYKVAYLSSQFSNVKEDQYPNAKNPSFSKILMLFLLYHTPIHLN